MKLPVNGAAYQHPSIDVNYQRCVNLFLSDSGPQGRGDAIGETKAVLLPTEGLQLIDSLGLSETRCSIQVNGNVYQVIGDSIYKLEINTSTRMSSSTLLGTIGSTQGTVYAAANPTQIIWVDGTQFGYIYNMETEVFSEITASDSDFPGADYVVFLDGYFIVNAPGTSQFYTSALNNGLSWDPLDVATAESSTDAIKQFGVSKGELWVFGSQSTEIWYDAANVSGSPFSQRSGLGLRMGIKAPASLQELNDTLIWLDHRGYIVQSEVSPFIRSNNSGYSLKIIADQAITNAIKTYGDVSDAIGMTFNTRGHLMYQITFPSAKKTWVFDYTTALWHERTYFDLVYGEQQHHLAQFSVTLNEATIMSGLRSGKVYISAQDIYTDDGNRIYRIRTTPVQYDEDDNRLATVNAIDLRMETGTVPSTGDGSDPYIGMRYSTDGGHTWSNRVSRSIGQIGQFAKPIRWNRLGYGREWIFEFVITEPIPFAIISATAQVGV